MTTTMTTATETKKVNGVDVGKVRGLIASIEADSSMADMRFRARNEWLGGGMNRTRV